MYRILIADDNELARRALKKSICWESLNCEYAGETLNGPDTMEFIKKEKPDIVLLDIKMPGMTGMEVVSALGEKANTTVFIMITAYDDFEFMRNGIQLGVFDYILKPISDQDLHNALKKAVNHIKSREKEYYLAQQYKEKSKLYHEQIISMNRELEEKLLIDALHGSAESAERFSKIMKKKYHIHDYFLLLIIPEKSKMTALETDEFIAAQIEITERYSNIHSAYLKGGRIKEGYVVLLSFKKTMIVKEYNIHSIKVAKFIYEENRKRAIEVYVAISHISSSLEGIDHLYEQVRFCSNGRFFMENKKIIHYDSLRSNSIRGQHKKINKLQELYDACRMHTDRITECMEEFLDQFLDDEIYDIEYVKNILIQAAIMMIYISKEQYVDKVESIGVNEVIQKLTGMSSLRNAFQWMRDFAEEIQKNYEAGMGVSIQTKRIIDYLEESYMNPITLKEAENYLGLSGTHISRLLKKETGETFVTLLNKIRVKKSIQLLKSGRYKVYEIAEMVGYSNYAYFYQIFKKHTGVSPKDYV